MDMSPGYPDSPSLDTEDISYPCKGCGQVLEEGKAFELAGHRWHIDCFRCNTCGTLLDSDANLLLLGDGSLICNNCTYSCSACGNKIEDLAILTGDQAYCAGCFRCRNCKKKIENLRYARTSQGMFCMDCHDALMARRRKKTKSARSKPGQNNAMLLDKSLPSLPPAAVSQSAFSPDQETLSDTYSESTPIELPGSTPTQSRSESMSHAPPHHRQHSGVSRRAELDDTESGFYIPLTLDPNPAPGPSPLRQSKFELEGESVGLSRENSSEYFNLRSTTSSRKPSYVQPPLGDDTQSHSPRVASQEQGWDSGQETPLTSRRREETRSHDGSHRDSSGRTSRENSEQSRFRLEDAPKRKKSSSKRNSRGEAVSHSQDTKTQPVPLREQASNEQSPRSSSLTAPNNLSGRLSQDSRNEESTHRDSSKSGSGELPVLPKRGDSLQPTPTTASSSIPRKEVGSTSRQPSSTQQSSSAPDSAISGTSEVHSSTDQSSTHVNGGRVIGPPMESPVSKSTYDFPTRSKDRPSLTDEDAFGSPRAAPAPETTNRHRSKPSIGSVRSESFQGVPSSPRTRYPDDEENRGIVDHGEHSFLRRVSKSVRHARSHSDRGDRNSKETKWLKSSFQGAALLEDHSSPIPSSPDARDDVSWLKGQLRQEREKSADLPKIEAELATMRVELEQERKKTSQLERRKSEYDDVVNDQNAIKQMNTELREKRSTMVVLDAQKEIVVRELEVLTDHIAASRKSKEPLDVNALSNAAMRDFAASLQKLKISFTPQIEKLTEKKLALTEEIDRLTTSKEKAQEEFQQLTAKNAQLMELNNNLVHQISQLHAAGVVPEGPQKTHGLGIYTHHNKDKSNLSVDSQGMQTSIAHSHYSGSTVIHEQDTEGGAMILNAPRVVNIRKEQPKKTFNWKKGGNVAKGMTKGIKGAFSSNQSPMAREGQPMVTEGMPYGSMSQNGELPTTIPPGPKGTPMEAQQQRQGFGFFGQPKKLQQQQPKGGMNGNYLAEEPLHPSKLFGVELTARAEYERTQIPSIVTRCIQEVELRGMDQEGIYRKSGGAAQIQVIRDGFVCSNDFDISDPDLDINAVTSCLKQYFRKLPTPLITFSVYDLLLDSNGCPNDEERITVMRAAVGELPPHHRDCLEFLVFHLARVIERDRENLMTAMNCAVVFAPTIMRPESIAREMTDTAMKNAAVQFLIENCHAVFMSENGSR